VSNSQSHLEESRQFLVTFKDSPFRQLFTEPSLSHTKCLQNTNPLLVGNQGHPKNSSGDGKISVITMAICHISTKRLMTQNLADSSKSQMFHHISSWA